VYVTPECDSVLDLIAHDKAGERSLEELLVDVGRRLGEEGIAGDIACSRTKPTENSQC